jgi:predicted transcriptional regulator
MRTTTVRLDDDQLRLLEAIAEADGARTADVIRDAIRDHIEARCVRDPAFAEFVTSIAEQRVADGLAQSRQQIRDALGNSALPDDAPAESSTRAVPSAQVNA